MNLIRLAHRVIFDFKRPHALAVVRRREHGINSRDDLGVIGLAQVTQFEREVGQSQPDARHPVHGDNLRSVRHPGARLDLHDDDGIGAKIGRAHV